MAGPGVRSVAKALPTVKNFLVSHQPSSTYTISLDSGTAYVFTGTAATLDVGVAPASGSYSFTGTAAALGVAIVPNGGTYSVSGTAATLDVGLFPAGGSYVFTGSPVTFGQALHLAADGGSYSFTGTIANLIQALGTIPINLTYFGGCPYITEEQSADYIASESVTDKEIYYRQEEG